MGDKKRTIIIAVVLLVILGPAAWYLTKPKPVPKKQTAEAKQEDQAAKTEKGEKGEAEAKDTGKAAKPKAQKTAAKAGVGEKTEAAAAPANKERAEARAKATGQGDTARPKADRETAPGKTSARATAREKEGAPAKETEREKPRERGGTAAEKPASEKETVVAAAVKKAPPSVGAIGRPRRDPFRRMGRQPSAPPPPTGETEPVPTPIEPGEVPPIITPGTGPPGIPPAPGVVSALAPVGPQTFVTAPPPGLWYPQSLRGRAVPPGEGMRLLGTVRGEKKGVASFRQGAEGDSSYYTLREGERVGSSRTKIRQIGSGNVVLSNDYTHEVVPVVEEPPVVKSPGR